MSMGSCFDLTCAHDEAVTIIEQTLDHAKWLGPTELRDMVLNYFMPETIVITNGYPYVIKPDQVAKIIKDKFGIAGLLITGRGTYY